MEKAVKNFKGEKIWEITFKNKKALIGLNLLSLILLIPSIGAVFKLSVFLRGGMVIEATFIDLLVTLLVVLFFLTSIHESLHGLCFWIYSRERPKFGFKIWYAYAAAPEWYFPKKQYIVITLCPLIVITLVGIALLPIIPSSAIFPLNFFIAANIGGSAGDIYVFCRILFSSKECMAKDIGNSLAFYV